MVIKILEGKKNVGKKALTLKSLKSQEKPSFFA
jgi:hypothetical protein